MTCSRILPSPGAAWLHGWPLDRYYCPLEAGHPGPCQNHLGQMLPVWEPTAEALAYAEKTALDRDRAAGRNVSELTA